MHKARIWTETGGNNEKLLNELQQDEEVTVDTTHTCIFVLYKHSLVVPDILIF